jgi:hypothetical protein
MGPSLPHMLGKKISLCLSPTCLDVYFSFDDYLSAQISLERHADVNTTMIYTHVLNKGGRGVISPTDA